MRTPELITSAANSVLKDVRKALARGGLTSSGCCVAETFHLLEEALRSPCRVRTVIAAERARARVEAEIGDRAGLRLLTVSDELLDSIADVATSQGVLALVEPPEYSLEQILATPSLVLVIDGLQDPGNLGTILRSAEAFGATGLLLLKGAVTPFNPKALRASAGSVFRVPLVCGLEENAVLQAVRDGAIDLYAAVPGAAVAPGDADLTRPCAIVIGSEGQGVSQTIRRTARDISIPTTGVESLNAAVSAAILLYEVRRQRSLHP